MRKKYTDKQQTAYNLYLHSNLTQKEIAKLAKTTEQTFCKWKKQFNWEKERAALVVTPDKIIADIYSMIATWNEQIKNEGRFPTPAESDALLKLATSIERIDKKISPSLVMNVFMRFNDWLVQSNPALVREILDYQTKYAQSLLNIV